MKHKTTQTLERIKKALEKRRLLAIKRDNLKLKRENLLAELELEILPPIKTEQRYQSWEELQGLRNIAKTRLSKLQEPT